MGWVGAAVSDRERAVWYSAFGSNLLRDRFIVYLTGGVIPHSTTGRIQEGARDNSLPTGDRPITIDRTLVFAGSSGQWGDGGTAAVDPDLDRSTPTLGRAYRITCRQFEDVFRQENRESSAVPLDLDALTRDGYVDLSNGKYGRAVVVGSVGDELAVTITTRERPTSLRAAHTSYLSVMAKGLMESWGLSEKAAAEYLATRAGNAGTVDPNEIIRVLGS